MSKQRPVRSALLFPLLMSLVLVLLAPVMTRGELPPPAEDPSVQKPAPAAKAASDGTDKRLKSIAAKYQAWSKEAENRELLTDFERQMQANFSLFPAVPVVKGTGWHQLTKVTLNRNGAGFDAIRISNQSTTDQDLVCALHFRNGKALDHCCIVAAKGFMPCFDKPGVFGKRSEYPGEPWTNGDGPTVVWLRQLTGGKIKAASEYLIWFTFKDGAPCELDVAINLVPVGTPLTAREKLESALGLKSIPQIKPSATVVAKSPSPESPTKPSLDAEAMRHFELGFAARKEGNLDKAIAEYSEAIRIAPKHYAAYYNRGCVWMQKREYDKAIADFSETIRLDPKFVSAYVNRGLTWRGKLEYDKAIADYSEAIRLDPKHASAYYNRGNAWAKLGSAGSWLNSSSAARITITSQYVGRGRDWKELYHKAIRDYDEALRLSPQDASLYAERASAWVGVGADDKAITDYTQSLRLKPQQADVYDARGWIYTDRGEFTKALADFDEAIRIAPANIWKYQERRGELWSQAGDVDRAIAEYVKALRNTPIYQPYFDGEKSSHVAGQKFLGDGSVWVSVSPYEKAIAYLNIALRFDPKLRSAVEQRGIGPVEPALRCSTVSGCETSRQSCLPGR